MNWMYVIQWISLSNKIDLIKNKLEFEKSAISELVANIHQLKNIKFWLQKNI